jgi:hypothetical protein
MYRTHTTIFDTEALSNKSRKAILYYTNRTDSWKD